MTIVVAYAETPPGRAAVCTALGEGALRREDVILVAAVRDETPPDPDDVVAAWPEEARSLTDAGAKLLAEASELRDPSDAVVQVSQVHDASMIVVGLRHRSPVGKALLGSTAQRILLEATCPVLTVRPG